MIPVVVIPHVSFDILHPVGFMVRTWERTFFSPYIFHGKTHSFQINKQAKRSQAASMIDKAKSSFMYDLQLIKSSTYQTTKAQSSCKHDRHSTSVSAEIKGRNQLPAIVFSAQKSYTNKYDVYFLKSK